MKDKSKLVTFVALVALVVAFGSTESGFPNLEAVGNSLFCVLGIILVICLVRGGGCCNWGSCRPATDSEGD